MPVVADSPKDTSDKPRFPCATCGTQYSRLEYLRRHERKHTEHRPFACSDCSKTFARSDVLLRHRRRCHPESVEKDAIAATATASAKGAAPATKTAVAKVKARGGRGRGDARRPSITTQNSQDTPEESPSLDSLPTLQEHDLETPVEIAFSMSLANGSPGASSYMHPSITDLVGQELRNANSWGQQPLAFGDATQPSVLQGVSPSLVPAFMSTNLQYSPQSRTSQSPYSSDLWTANGAGGFPPAMFTVDPVTTDSIGANTIWGQIASQPAPFTDAELFAYLAGESPTAANELGLNIFQPERSLMQAEASLFEPMLRRPFQALDPGDRFYLPPGVFAGCYTVPHWMLPPLFKLCRIASHTLGILTSQMSIIHEPTFRLDRTHAFTAFSMCTTGTKDPFDNTPLCSGQVGDGCAPDPWKWVSAIIRQEKSEMLVKNFARRGRMMSFAESFSLIQALIIYHVPALLSTEHSNRITGLLFLSSIVQIARHVGLFKTDAEWLKPVSVEGDIELRWKEWIQRETVRRTTWLVYVLDTIASIEAGIASHLPPRDMRYFPLPAPAPVWNARDASEWAEAMRKYPVDYPMDKLLSKTFDLRNPSPCPEFTSSKLNTDGSVNEKYVPAQIAKVIGDAWTSSPCANKDCLGTRLLIGPFARLVVVLTLLRGLIEFGEGKRKGGQVTQIWAVKPEALDRDPNAGLEVNILASYKRAFDRWRMGWDIDRLCHIPYGAPQASLFNNPNIPGLTILNPAPCRDSTFMHDATPYFWFGTVLMDLLRSKFSATTSNAPRPGVFGDVEEGDIGSDSGDDERVNLFKGLDYRGMLDVAKQFAHGGEGI